MAKVLLLLTLSVITIYANAQNAKTHYIAPSPWQYWTKANELVITTLSSSDVTVQIRKSDRTLIGTVTVNLSNPKVYTFSGDPFTSPYNPVNTVLKDAGIILEATDKIFANLRNIMSDYLPPPYPVPDGYDSQIATQNIKGNASMVSFGDQGRGIAFRLAYYRTQQNGVKLSGPVYPVMAIYDNTVIKLNGSVITTLNAGESYILTSKPGQLVPQGSLLESSAPVVVNGGAAWDIATGCGDGVIDQLPPITILGKKYLIIRGNGREQPMADQSEVPEQTIVTAHHNNTLLTIQNYDPSGKPHGTVVTKMLNAGETFNFLHGDAKNRYSSSYITSSHEIAVYYGTGDNCEVDMSAVPPFNECAGSEIIQTTAFKDYNGGALPYFGFVITDDPTNPILLNNEDLEKLTGSKRVAVGTTGYYLLTFNEIQIKKPTVITIKASNSKRVAVSFIQSGGGFSMASYFSIFNDIPTQPTISDDLCRKKFLTAEPGLEPYQWYRNDTLIADATGQIFTARQNGNYSYRGTKPCGITAQSPAIYIEAGPVDSFKTVITKSICEGESYITPQQTYSETGTYTEFYETVKTRCDSIVTIHLTKLLKSYHTIDTSICEGSSYVSSLKSYTKEGSYTEILKADNDCDSILTINVSVRPRSFTTVDTSICFATAYTTPKGTYTAAGTYTEIYTAANKCDSIVTIRLKIDPKITSGYTKEICQGDTYTTPQKSYTTAGTYTEIYTSVKGCDSTVTLTLIINPPKFTTVNPSLCEGQILTTPQGTYSEAGTYTEVYKSSKGCDSTVTINLSYRKIARDTISRTICQGGNVEGYTQTGIYTNKFTAKNLCDSFRTLILTVNPLSYKTIDTSICFGTAYTSPKGTYTAAGTYTETYTAANKCDSIVTIRLKIDPKITSGYTKEICQGESYSTPQKSYTTAGTYTEIYTSAKGCDSTVTLTLIINSPKFTTVNPSLCEGQILKTPVGNYSETGTYTEVYKSSKGCDSTVTINLSYRKIARLTIDRTICEGETVEGYSKSGTYINTFTAKNGCDSIRTLNLSVIEKGNNLEYKTICEGESYRGYTVSGTYSETRTSGSGCAANFTVFLTVIPKSRKTIDTSICFGTAYTSPKGTYTAAGTYTETYTAASKCDSIVTIRLKIDPKITSGYTKEICQGDTYTTPQKSYTTAGTYTEIYTSAKGCDSTVTFQLIVNTPKFTTLNPSLCEGQILTTPQASYSVDGTYTEVYKSSKGCDSTVTINLSYREIARQTIDRTICEGESFEGYSKSGTYTNKFIAKNGCDSIRTLNLSVIEKGNNLEYKTICEGESYRGYTVSGTYSETRTSGSGCVANFTVFLTVLPKARKTIDTSICFGTAYTSPKGTYTAAGTYTEIYTAASKCDSIVTIRLTIDPKISSGYTKEICQGDTYTTPQKTYTTAGTFTEIYTSAKGCDSTVTFQLIVHPLKYTTIDTSLCEGQSLTTPKTTYSNPGTYKEVYQSFKGCDSTVTINLAYRIIPRVTLDKILCEGESFEGYTKTGLYRDTFVAKNGCDSIRILNLTIIEKGNNIEYKTICEGESYRGYTVSGTYNETRISGSGCDSKYTIYLTVVPKVFETIDTTICEGQIFKGYSATGMYTELYKSAAGCDSIVTVRLNVLKKSYLTIDTSICEGSSFKNYTKNGTYTEVYKASNGCDSIVTIKLSIKDHRTTQIDTAICDGTMFKSYSKTGTYIEKYTAANGCDSTVLIMLTVKPIKRTLINTSICDGETFKGYTTGGVYTETYTSSNGCDSIVTVNLTIFPVYRYTLKQTICEDESFRGFKETGVYIQPYKTKNGCDSIITVDLTVLKKSYTVLNQSICEGDNFKGYTNAGVYKEVYRAANGCDSTVTINLTIKKKQRQLIVKDICEGTTFKGYDKSGTYIETYQGENGCDSIVTIKLTVRPHTSRIINKTICFGQSFEGYTETGTYIDTLINQWGCDSVRQINLTVQYSKTVFFEADICAGERYRLPNGLMVSRAGIYRDTVKSTIGCDSLIRETRLWIKPIPTLTVTKSNDINCVIAMSKLEASGGVRYLWSPAYGLSNPTIPNPIASPRESTNYRVTTWGTNGCKNETTIDVKVHIDPEKLTYPVPNTFSPNKDGLNDCFNVRHWGPVLDFKMTIYNRWGEIVFKTTNPNDCWNGTKNGIEQPTGVFVYQIDASGACGIVSKKGFVTLVR